MVDVGEFRNLLAVYQDWGGLGRDQANAFEQATRVLASNAHASPARPFPDLNLLRALSYFKTGVNPLFGPEGGSKVSVSG